MPRKPIPLPEDTVMLDPRVRLRIALKNILMWWPVYLLTGAQFRAMLFQAFRLEAL